MKPVIAIVGRPNVGKSMLFNKLSGKRLSIVDNTPGVTRDRLYAESEWRGRVFTVIDTGGIEPRTDNEILKFMRTQAEIAIQNADVVVFVVDVRTGLTATDDEVATMLQKSKKPCILAVNKVDQIGLPPAELYEFYNLGMGDPFSISALHGHGMGDLLDECFKYFPAETEPMEEEENVKVCIIGKPNAGKSSLINKILGSERVIVSDVPGTTRDSVDAPFENKHGKFIFVDTAGIRKKSKVNNDIEHYSVLHAIMAIERSNVCVIMIDATEGVTEQDTKIAGFAHEKGKASIIVVNKWDLIEKETNTMEKMRQKVSESFSHMAYAPIIFISAKTGMRLDKLFETIVCANEQNKRRITTGQLNDILNEATAKVPPPTDRGRRLKVYYMTQTGVRPPTFVVFCNDIRLFHYSYQRYIENQVREVFSLIGTPIKLILRDKDEK